MKKLFIDEDECIGCNLCVELCPTLFKEAVFVPTVANIDVTNDSCAEDVVIFCPVGCIYIK